MRLKKDSDMNAAQFAYELESAGISFEGFELGDDGFWHVEVSETDKPKAQQLIQIHHQKTDIENSKDGELSVILDEIEGFKTALSALGGTL